MVSEKKEQGTKPCSKIVSTLNFLENVDLILIVEATLLVRVRAPPETWTTKLEPLGQPEVEIGRPSFSSCHHFRQRLFKIPALCEMIGNLLLTVVDLAAIRPRLGIGVGHLARGVKCIAFRQVYSLKLQHSSGNLISTSDSHGD
jgi:hypothetical protein